MIQNSGLPHIPVNKTGYNFLKESFMSPMKQQNHMIVDNIKVLPIESIEVVDCLEKMEALT